MNETIQIFMLAKHLSGTQEQENPSINMLMQSSRSVGQAPVSTDQINFMTKQRSCNYPFGSGKDINAN